MDVEQLRKINEMSKTLQKHGLATTSEEGSQLAGSMMEEDVPNRGGPEQSAQETKQNTDKAELLIERHARKVSQALEALTEKIHQLENRVAMQEQQLRSPRQAEQVVINDVQPSQQQQESPQEAGQVHVKEVSHTHQSPQQTSSQSQPTEQAPPAQPQKPARPEGAKPQLRSDPDHFDVSELSVEKMFYYGNK